MAVPTDTPSPQSRARAAALRASTPTGSVSVTSSALTTRAAAPTTWSSASPKVCSEWLGGPGVPSAAGDSLPPSLPAVTRGDVFTLPEDEYSFHDYREETRSNTSVQAQPEGSTQTFVQWVQPEETPGQTPVLNPEEETPGPGWGNSEPEVGTLSPETGNLGIAESPAEEEQCSGKPFDAFTDLKNGSLFAFRGDSGGRLWGWGSAPGASCLTQPPSL